MEVMKLDTSRHREPEAKTAIRHNEPQKPIKLLGPGDEDESGHRVEDVYFSTAKYQIYLADDRVRYCLPEDYETATQLRKKLYPFSRSFDNVQTMRADPDYRGSREFPARTLARAMAQAFDSEPESAKRIIESLETRMSAAIASHLRTKYVLANACVIVVLVVLLLCALYALPQLAADTAFPFSAANVPTLWVFYLLAFLAGFSESIVPDTLHETEQLIDEQAVASPSASQAPLGFHKRCIPVTWLTLSPE